MKLGWILAALLAAQVSAASAADNVIRIGVLNDQSGVFADNGGRGSIAAARLAAEDFGNEI
jgi:branched-chain amino acid transport system substrate-binding protein